MNTGGGGFDCFRYAVQYQQKGLIKANTLKKTNFLSKSKNKNVWKFDQKSFEKICLLHEYPVFWVLQLTVPMSIE